MRVNSASRQPLRQVFDAEPKSRSLDRFGWLLLLTYGTIAAQSLVDPQVSSGGLSQQVANLAAVCVSSAMLVLAMHASGVSHRWRRSLLIVIGAALVGHVMFVIAALSSEDTRSQTSGAPPIGALILAVLAFFFVVHRLASHRRITASTLLGAITAYLMIPLVFYYAFLTVDALSKTPFFGRPAIGQEFMFFSLTTVTTLGYGNPVPVSDLGQLLAATEALVGQLYLVVVVALIVGLMASRWQSNSAAADDQ